MKKIMVMISLAAMALSAVAQDKNTRFIRLEVHEGGEDGTHVNMTLPLNTLNAFEPAVRQALTEISVNGQGLNLAEIWQAVKDSGPMDYVEVQEHDSTIKISTTGTHVVVRAEGEMADNIHVSIPFELCDAIFRDVESFDFQNLIAVLENMAGEDLVNIDTDNERIRIWIE
ncbi:MAG: hypothetical protein KDC35_20140 [Acidobacteria bacterium]|nr:hypothetical protein [Acidobacteriota bacterium]